MCIRQEPDPQQRERQINQMTNNKFRNLVRRCVKIEPWLRPQMPSIIEDLERPEVRQTGVSQRYGIGATTDQGAGFRSGGQTQMPSVDI